MEVYTFKDVAGETVQTLRTLLLTLLPEKTYIGTNYDETNEERYNHIILNIQGSSEFSQGALRTYTCSGVVVSNSRSTSVELNELVIAGFKALPRKMTILKSIKVENSGTVIEASDGQKSMRGFTISLIVKATEKIEI